MATIAKATAATKLIVLAISPYVTEYISPRTEARLKIACMTTATK
jgi:hypothetical protein